MRLLVRYVAAEVAKTFLLSLSVLAGIVFLVSAFQALHKFNLLAFAFLLRILPGLMASSFSLTLPFALLVAATLTLGRLSADNEITALKACGVHLGWIFAPILAMALALSAASFYLHDVVVPRAYVDRDEIPADAIKDLLKTQLTAGATTIDFVPGCRISYSGIRDGKFQDLVIHRLEGVSASVEIVAEEAEVEFDDVSKRIRFRVRRGSVSRMIVKAQYPHQHPDELTAPFEMLEVDIDLPLEKKKIQPRPSSLTLHAIATDWIPRREAEIAGYRSALAEVEATIEREGPLETHVNERANLVHWIEQRDEWVHELRSAYHFRIASSFASLFIVLVGAPLGILVRHSNKLIAFGVSALVALFFYYPLLILGKELAEKGRIHPVPGAWMANAALGALGLFLIWRVLRR